MDIAGILNLESKKRSDLGIDLFKKYNSSCIITLGWDYREDSDLYISDCVKNYICSRKINPEVIISENNSRDTVGDAIFSKLVVSKTNYNKIMITTSNYHIARTKTIFKMIYGNEFRLYFCGVRGFSSKNKIAHEKDSLSQFFLTFNRFQKTIMISIIV